MYVMYGSMFGLPAAKPLTPEASLSLRSNGRARPQFLMLRACLLETEIEAPEEEAVTSQFGLRITLSC